MTKQRDYSIGTVAEMTGRHPETLRVLARDGQLPGAYKVGRKWLVNRETFERHRNGGRATPDEAA